MTQGASVPVQAWAGMASSLSYSSTGATPSRLATSLLGDPWAMPRNVPSTNSSTPASATVVVVPTMVVDVLVVVELLVVAGELVVVVTSVDEVDSTAGESMDDELDT